MAHFAQIDNNGVVVQVIVVNNSEIGNLPFPDSEQLGIQFCKSLYGEDTVWKQTSYNKNFRGEYAGVGYVYDSENDVFVNPNIIPPKPYTPFPTNEADIP